LGRGCSPLAIEEVEGGTDSGVTSILGWVGRRRRVRGGDGFEGEEEERERQQERDKAKEEQEWRQKVE
jgi:hypothetical protein